MKKFVFILLCAALTFSLAGCMQGEYTDVNDTPDTSLPAPTSHDELYSLYNKIQRDMTKAQADALFGDGEPVLDDYGDIKYYNYLNDKKSAGVSVIYDVDDVVKTKLLWFNSKKSLVPFSGRYDNDKISKVKSGMTVEKAVEVMGSSPLELSCTFGNEGPLNMKKIYCWYNEDTSNFMLHTDDGTIENVVLYRN